MFYNTDTTNQPSYATGGFRRVASGLAALAVTVAVQGSLLAGFNHLATRADQESQVNAKAVTLPAVTVVHKRG